MGRKDIFRTAVFGGYQKEDVMDYVRSLENEKETVKILANKEKSELQGLLEETKKQLEEENLLRQKACEQLDEVKESSLRWQQEIAGMQKISVQRERELSDAQECCQRQEKELTQIRECFMQRTQEREEAGKQQELMQETLVQERLDMQEKQNVWADSLRRMQTELQERQEQWEQLRAEAARRSEKESVLESSLEQEMREKERFSEEIRKLQMNCEKEMHRLQHQYQKECQRIQQQMAVLKRDNAVLLERCKKMEAQEKTRQKENGRRTAPGGMKKWLNPVVESVKRNAGGAAIHLEMPVTEEKPAAEYMDWKPDVKTAAEAEEKPAAPQEKEVMYRPESAEVWKAKGKMETEGREKENSPAAAERLPAFGEENESAEQQYRKRADDVNWSITSAQERIAKMLEELQRDMTE